MGNPTAHSFFRMAIMYWGNTTTASPSRCVSADGNSPMAVPRTAFSERPFSNDSTCNASVAVYYAALYDQITKPTNRVIARKTSVRNSEAFKVHIFQPRSLCCGELSTTSQSARL